MSTLTPPRKSRLFNIVVIALIVIAAFAVKPLKILYHESGMRRAWNSTFQHGGTNTTEIARFERHRDALVASGYLQRREIQPAHVQSESPEFAALYKDLNQHASEGNGYFSMQGFEKATTPVIVVWSVPAKMAGWDAIIQKHDQPKKDAATEPAPAQP